jgi:hypothetical protein
VPLKLISARKSFTKGFWRDSEIVILDDALCIRSLWIRLRHSRILDFSAAVLTYSGHVAIITGSAPFKVNASVLS